MKGLHLLSDEGGGTPFPGSNGDSEASAGGLEDDFCKALSDLAGGVIQKHLEGVGVGGNSKNGKTL